MAEFTSADLRAVIREVAASTDAVSPDEIAEQVLHKLTRSQVRAALMVTLPNYVRIAVSVRTSQSHPVGVDPQDATGDPEPIRDSRPGVNRNTRATRVAAWFAVKRTERLHVGDDWKRFGACTADDLRVVAKRRGEQAADILAEQQRWADRAADMDANDWATVDDVPDDAMSRWFGRDAA